MFLVIKKNKDQSQELWQDHGSRDAFEDLEAYGNRKVVAPYHIL